eukprot:jgi/Mesvir1/9450/Mv17840-RA.1
MFPAGRSRGCRRGGGRPTTGARAAHDAPADNRPGSSSSDEDAGGQRGSDENEGRAGYGRSRAGLFQARPPPTASPGANTPEQRRALYDGHNSLTPETLSRYQSAWKRFCAFHHATPEYAEGEEAEHLFTVGAVEQYLESRKDTEGKATLDKVLNALAHFRTRWYYIHAKGAAPNLREHEGIKIYKASASSRSKERARPENAQQDAARHITTLKYGDAEFRAANRHFLDLSCEGPFADREMQHLANQMRADFLDNHLTASRSMETRKTNLPCVFTLPYYTEPDAETAVMMSMVDSKQLREGDGMILRGAFPHVDPEVCFPTALAMMLFERRHIHNKGKADFTTRASWYSEKLYPSVESTFISISPRAQYDYFSHALGPELTHRLRSKRHLGRHHQAVSQGLRGVSDASTAAFGKWMRSHIMTMNYKPIFPEVGELEAIKAKNANANQSDVDFAAEHWLEFLLFARTLLCQSIAVLQDRFRYVQMYQHHPIIYHEIFSGDAWDPFAAKVVEVHNRGQVPPEGWGVMPPQGVPQVRLNRNLTSPRDAWAEYTCPQGQQAPLEVLEHRHQHLWRQADKKYYDRARWFYWGVMHLALISDLFRVPGGTPEEFNTACQVVVDGLQRQHMPPTCKSLNTMRKEFKAVHKEKFPGALAEVDAGRAGSIWEVGIQEALTLRRALQNGRRA